ncbi:MAG: TetR/AcrR family transcriptional regulator [Chroococcidiopsidaceae cyanobacterium CP_BM_RX_35]|nr:TetR/AcrR family transcriptional regulator [Chroococcidiopsidaceae cyanobacterium CP_BM_RX_35]
MIDANRSNQVQLAGAKKRRREQSYHAILESSLAILAEKGYGALTIESIAARARVSKQTIYRWWSSKAAIVLEALLTDVQQRLPVPDTGSVRGDIEVLLSSSLRELADRSGPIVRGLMAEAQLDPEFGQAFREDFIARRREVLIKILCRGQRSGEISTLVDLELIVDLIYGPMWYRLLNQHAPIDEDFAQRLIAQIFAGLH